MPPAWMRIFLINFLMLSQIPIHTRTAARPMANRPTQSAATMALRRAQSPVDCGLSLSKALDKLSARSLQSTNRTRQAQGASCRPARHTAPVCSPRGASAAAGRRSRALTSLGVRSARSPIATADGCTSQRPSARLRPGGSTAAAFRTSRSGWPRRICGSPSPRDASPTSCCWWSTRPGRWLRGAGWGQSKPPHFPPAGRIPAQGQGRLDHFPGSRRRLRCRRRPRSTPQPPVARPADRWQDTAGRGSAVRC